MASRKRDHLVETALRLFCRDGYHATGIDRILAEAGVAKMTLYNHFRSKDELILAALRLQDERFRNRVMQHVERTATNPPGRLLALFDALDAWFRDESFSGCPFIHAAGEYHEPDDPIHMVAGESKRLMEYYVRSLARAAAARDPDGLARQIRLLMEGAIVYAHVVGEVDAIRDARSAADLLIQASTTSPSRGTQPNR